MSWCRDTRQSLLLPTALPEYSVCTLNCTKSVFTGGQRKASSGLAFSKTRSPMWLKHNRELLCLGRSCYPHTAPLTQQSPQYSKPSPGSAADPSFSPWHVPEAAELTGKASAELCVCFWLPSRPAELTQTALTEHLCEVHREQAGQSVSK